jgi:DHA3 family tetracycline resistance protein-like MFS transporter
MPRKQTPTTKPALKRRKTGKKLDATLVYLLAMFVIGFVTKIVYTTHVIYRVQVVGMDALQLVLAGTISEIAIFLFEVPTGVVADIYSRRLSTLIGFFVVGVAFIIEGIAPLIGLVLLSQAIGGFGGTFISGAFSAWITDEVGLKKVGALFLRGRQLTLLGALLGIPFSVLFSKQSLALPFIIGGGMHILFALFLVAFMPERGFMRTPPEERQGWRNFFKTFTQGVKLVRGRRVLMIFTLIALFAGLYSEAWDRLGQAYLLQTFTFPHLVNIELDTITWFGLLNTALILFAILSNEIAKRVVDTTKPAALLKALQGVYATMVAAMLVFTFTGQFYVAIAAMMLFDAVRGVSFPLTEAWLNQHIRSKLRATVLSMAGQVDAFGEIAGGPLLGTVGRVFSMRAALFTSALILAPTVPLYRKIRSITKK